MQISKSIHIPPPPPPVTTCLHAEAKVAETTEKCQNPQSWKVMNVPERNTNRGNALLSVAKVHLYSLCHTWLNLRTLNDRQTAISCQASLIITAASQYSETASRIENSIAFGSAPRREADSQPIS